MTLDQWLEYYVVKTESLKFSSEMFKKLYSITYRKYIDFLKTTYTWDAYIESSSYRHAMTFK